MMRVCHKENLSTMEQWPGMSQALGATIVCVCAREGEGAGTMLTHWGGEEEEEDRQRGREAPWLVRMRSSITTHPHCVREWVFDYLVLFAWHVALAPSLWSPLTFVLSILGGQHFCVFVLLLPLRDIVCVCVDGRGTYLGRICVWFRIQTINDIWCKGKRKQ